VVTVSGGDLTPEPLPTRCTGTRRSDGAPCQAGPIRGGRTCKRHGGQVRTHKAAAVRTLELQRHMAIVAKFELDTNPPPIGDPLDALRGHVARVQAWCAYLEARVAHLTRTDSDLHTNTPMGEAVKAVVKLYSDALDKQTTALAALHKTLADDRWLRIQEYQAVRVVAAVERAFQIQGAPLPGPLRREIAAQLRAVS
jgi:hypothetical protein